MDHTTTREMQDLFRYAYNETGLKDSDRIQRKIDGDPLVASEYREVIEVINKLDEGICMPSDEVVNRILDKAAEISKG